MASVLVTGCEGCHPPGKGRQEEVWIFWSAGGRVVS